MTKRNAILTGVSRAAELHEEMGLREKLRDGSGPVDVFAVIAALNVMVLFRPLEGLLGAYVPTPNAAGMLITTQRNLHVQRFTASHELGHHVLKHHAPSLDLNVGFVARGEKNGYEPQEVEADAFAGEFLLPAWLIAAHARRQGWGRTELRRPEVVYQLSLRLAASYSATCWALASAKFISQADANALASLPPKQSKMQALTDVAPPSWHPDVWVLSARDHGAQLVGGPQDFVVFSLDEHSGGGYEWDMDPLPSCGLEVRVDQRIEKTVEATVIGGPVTRRVVTQSSAPARTRLMLEERRPWEGRGAAINSIDFDLALLGKEPVGLLRRERTLAA